MPSGATACVVAMLNIALWSLLYAFHCNFPSVTRRSSIVDFKIDSVTLNRGCVPVVEFKLNQAPIEMAFVGLCLKCVAWIVNRGLLLALRSRHEPHLSQPLSRTRASAK